ncbi:response regulator [Paracidovorax sp. MALMAid1276]|uniref:response regulator n=1 Tax=Paracidovorax sp. MALMAid1276 TaxID=3411631 RepID=UPI003B9AD3F6
MLTKPVSPSQLFDAAVRALGRTAVTAASLPARPARGARDMSALRGARVLLVDDNDLNQQVGAELLAAAGVVVDVADNGQVALDMLAARAYDLVLMDMQMPVMDGLTATRHLRLNPAWAKLPVLAMTANAMTADRDRCLQAGMNGHLAKPIDPDELFAALLQWIAPGAARAATPQDVAAGSDDKEARGAGSPISPATAGRAGATLEQALQGIEGLDVPSGLRRVLGKRAAYENLLRKFVAGQAQAVHNARQALAEGRQEDAQRAMHTLKGTAATIGAAGLAQRAQAAEQALVQQAPHAALDPLLQSVHEACQPLVAALQQALPPENEVEDAHDTATHPAATGAQPDAVAAKTLVSRLDALLADDDSDAIELFKESAPLLKATLGAAAHTAIRRALDGYDFVQALALLRAAPAHHSQPAEVSNHE